MYIKFLLDNGDVILKAATILVGALFSALQLRKLIPRSRTQLKADLEILKLLDPADPNFPLLKSHIDAQIKATYSAGTGRHSQFKVQDTGHLVIGIIMCLVFIPWTLYLVRDGFTWWALGTGFFAFAGFGNLMMAFETPREPR
jgi:hypothetical protein